MVKSLRVLALIAGVASAYGVHGNSITNISQCINRNLTTEVLAMFPTNATSSAQSCVLTFVKGSVCGDLRTFATPFSDAICVSEFGFSGIDSIPESVSNEFSVLMSSISNCICKVISYSETITNGLIRANITLHRQGEYYNRAEVSHLDIAQTNNVWHIISWDVDE